MSVKIPELSFISTFETLTTSVVNCEGYSQLSYYIILEHDGDLTIQTSVDGIDFYQHAFINVLSTGTIYQDKLNITFKYVRFVIQQSLPGECQLQSFFFELGDTKITEYISSSGILTVNASGPINSSVPGGPVTNISMSQATSAIDGYLSYTDWNTFNNKVSSVSGSAPVSSSGGVTPTISISQATTSADGYLSSADWNTFNSKQAAGTYVTSVSASSPLSSTGTTTPTISLNDSGAVAGSYTNSNITISAKGIVTSISSGSSGGNKSFFAASAADSSVGIGISTIYSSLSNSRGAEMSSTIARVNTVIPCAGTFSRLYANRDTTSLSLDVTCTLYVDGVASALTCTIPYNGTDANDTTHSVNVSAGQKVAIGWVTVGGTTATRYFNTGVQFVAS